MNTKPFSPLSLLTIMIMTVYVSACKNKNQPINPVPIVIGCNDVNLDATWEDRGDGIDYILDCAITVNAKLTIKPGVTIQCKTNSGIIVETAGTLVAAGTAAAPISFAGDVAAAGVWKGIYIRSSSVLNEISYCTVSHAGNSSFDGSTGKMANIRVNLTARLKLTNSTISKSLKDGLLIDGLDTDDVCPISNFSSNNFTDNLNYPISAIASLGNLLDGNVSTYTGNTKNKILFRGGNLFGTHAWKKMAVPYFIENVVSIGYDIQNGNLTIEPGSTLQFANDAGLCTGDYATGSWLKANGTASERIVFTGETALPGTWKGIAFQSTNPNNQISYADISYGGSSSYTGATQKKANLHAGAWSNGTFTIANSTISNSGAWGIWVTLGSPGVTVPGSVTYSGNASGNYYAE